jgi:hypothetical protein
MPDDMPPPGERHYQSRSNFPAAEEGLEFVTKQIAALPTRPELIRFSVWVELGSALAR